MRKISVMALTALCVFAACQDASADLDFDWWFRTVTYDNPNK